MTRKPNANRTTLLHSKQRVPLITLTDINARANHEGRRGDSHGH